MNLDRLKKLAALEGIGALDGPELAEFQAAVTHAQAVLAVVRQYREVAFNLARSIEGAGPSPQLKQRIMSAISDRVSKPIASTAAAPFTYLTGDPENGWQQVAVPGASFKVLSTDPARGYVVALGKLEPGTRYPAHQHRNAEDVFILSGDLTINGRQMDAGDFHRAEAGTTHEENYSKTGCTILIVLSMEDLAAQMQSAA